MITREDLHKLIDQLPECVWAEGREAVEDHLALHEPVLHSIDEAPEVNPTPAEIAAIEEVYAETKAGQGHWSSQEEVVKRLSELP